MARINNNQARRLVQKCEPFRNNNGTMYGTPKSAYGDKWYVVYSYGDHWPMYIKDMVADHWYANKDKASRTTSRHASQACPHGVELTFLSEDKMCRLARLGPNEYVKRELAEGIKYI